MSDGGNKKWRRPRGQQARTTEAPPPLERPLQAAICDTLKLLLPRDAFLTAIPGGDRQVTLTPGYEAGMTDLLIIYRGRAICVELKRDTRNGVISQAQIAVHERITLAGGVVATCRSLEDVLQFLAMLGVPLRGKVSA